LLDREGDHLVDPVRERGRVPVPRDRHAVAHPEDLVGLLRAYEELELGKLAVEDASPSRVHGGVVQQELGPRRTDRFLPAVSEVGPLHVREHSVGHRPSWYGLGVSAAGGSRPGEHSVGGRKGRADLFGCQRLARESIALERTDDDLGIGSIFVDQERPKRA
jgi:hypothetical protein